MSLFQPPLSLVAHALQYFLQLPRLEGLNHDVTATIEFTINVHLGEPVGTTAHTNKVDVTGGSIDAWGSLLLLGGLGGPVTCCTSHGRVLSSIAHSSNYGTCTSCFWVGWPSIADSFISITIGTVCPACSCRMLGASHVCRQREYLGACVCLPAALTCLPACPLDCLPACLPVCLPPCRSACLYGWLSCYPPIVHLPVPPTQVGHWGYSFMPLCLVVCFPACLSDLSCLSFACRPVFHLGLCLTPPPPMKLTWATGCTPSFRCAASHSPGC